MEHRKIISVILVFVLLMGLAACSAQKPPEQTLSGLQDPSLFRQQDRGEFFLETEDCYYYLYNRKIYFSSKTDLCFYFLCNKPNCPHGGEDCNADGGSALGYWNGHLYSARLIGTMEPSVIRMDLDGGNHKEIAKIMLPVNESGSEGGAYTFFFNNGALYYHVLATPEAFFRLNLSTGKTEQLFQEYFQDGIGLLDQLRFSGDDVYLIMISPGGEWRLKRYRLTDQTLVDVCPWSKNYLGMMVDGQKVCYFDADRRSFFEYDLATGTTEERLRVDCYGAAHYDIDYIYLITWENADFSDKRLSLYTPDYQFLGQLGIPDGFDFDYATQDYLFFAAEMSNRLTYYLPKSSIGSGDLELLPLPDPYSYR